MIEIELPCCERVTRVPVLSDEIRCEECGVVFEIEDLQPQRLPIPAAA